MLSENLADHILEVIGKVYQSVRDGGGGEGREELTVKSIKSDVGRRGCY